jgi:hypothetical protein
MTMRTATILALPLLALAACAGENETFPQELLPYGSEVPEALACLPNLDGRIDSGELSPTLNQIASYRVSPPLPVESDGARPMDLTGEVGLDGRRVWDWSSSDDGDRVATFMAKPLTDQWYVPHFSGGQFSMPTDAAGRVHAVYSHDAQALRLHGVASFIESPPEGQTLMVYEVPVDFFPFPLTVGDSWAQTGRVRNGVLLGVKPWSQDDLYEVQVDLAGELRLPDFTFAQAMRVLTKVTIKPKAGMKKGTTQYQVSFVYECFGEVARAASPFVLDPEQDPGPDFPLAWEVRRLGWF